MSARRGLGIGKKLKRFLLRVVLLFFAALAGLQYLGVDPLHFTQSWNSEAGIARAGALREVFDAVTASLHPGKKTLRSSDSSRFSVTAQNAPLVTLENLPEYAGRSFVVLHRNEPLFSAEFKARKNAFYSFTPLDGLGRCGAAYGKLGPEFLPTKPRGTIGMIKPTGWRYSKYDDIEQKYLYNRCHLLAFQLTGENANKLNLITGTRYFNVTGMLPFENRVADYIRRTGKHVWYRVTPFFKGNDLVARGVSMEALSADDGGKALRFHVFVYNVQPGIEINYANGMNHRK